MKPYDKLQLEYRKMNLRVSCVLHHNYSIVNEDVSISIKSELSRRIKNIENLIAGLE